jgi:hypothetical protein
VYAESDTTFFKKDVDAQIAFIKDSRGEVAALLVHRETGKSGQNENGATGSGGHDSQCRSARI